ncbi:alpha/beta hydrolase [Listeria grandensis]|uniref:alpha/beta hydrolase n=1 Tax=Listeria grandensis TaxID=1494963 RepID=UPI001625C383|nr:alpha/beta hydrolase [Listeria grandensis]MBC1475967.1 alpha/beta hydrolase [Listeria grandensis]
MQTIIFAQKNNVELKGDFYPSPRSDASKTIIYFHGGGLIWGLRNDLPETYRNLFLEAGYHFFAVDYRLAPETKLPALYEDVQDAILWFEANARAAFGVSNAFILFGRSAGAYLALQAAADATLPNADAVLSFYGYASIAGSWYQKPSAHYAKLPAIPVDLKKALVQRHELAEGFIEKRYALYIYCRQTGTWLDEVFGLHQDSDLDAFCLEEMRDFSFLPPVFIAHSTADQDVPYSEAEKIAQTTFQNELFTVRDLEHDFDKNIDDGLPAYQQALRFLEAYK